MSKEGNCSSKCEYDGIASSKLVNEGGDGQPEAPSGAGAVPKPSHISDEDGKAALDAMKDAAFGDPSRWRACIPAREDDTDMVVYRWVRQVLAERDALRRAKEAPGAERAVFEAGYGIGYGNGRVDGRCDEFSPSPGDSFDLWKAGPQSGTPFGDVDEQGIRDLVAKSAGELLHDLLTALSVPEHADPVEWARALVGLANDVRPRVDQPLVVGRLPGIGAAERVLALRIPPPLPRALPTEAGLWHLDTGGVAKVEDGPGCAGWCVVAVIDNPRAELALREARKFATGTRPLVVSELSWLTGPDGLAVRCVPPEVTP